MRCVYVLCLLAVMAVSGEELYPESIELGIEHVVRDYVSLQEFAGCFLDLSICETPLPGVFQYTAEVVQTACAKCRPYQKHVFRRFLEGIKFKFPRMYTAFREKYDPEGKHFDALEDAVADA